MRAAAFFGRDIADCVVCPRLAAHLAALRQREPDWRNRPVPAFGSLAARLLIVGLGPGEKGANRTGRPFTGDVAGELLYPALHRFGFASVAEPLDSDKSANPRMRLVDARITNAVRCLPPANKPTSAEIRACNPHLAHEIAAMPRLTAILALGGVAHQSVLRALRLKPAQYPFGHNLRHDLPAPLPTLFTSYHCSGYNWRTGRLSRESFERVFESLRTLLPRVAEENIPA
ncbi:MAG: uracil-DNA glycosylase [Zoogloeaceae bacterium]|jgi:uracil-DNA glycosylase|nr:uracil-DNA glycosylase [Zoogloeaceae bacterium]